MSKNIAIFLAGCVAGFIGCLVTGFGVCELVELLDGDDE